MINEFARGRRANGSECNTGKGGEREGVATGCRPAGAGDISNISTMHAPDGKECFNATGPVRVCFCLDVARWGAVSLSVVIETS